MVQRKCSGELACETKPLWRSCELVCGGLAVGGASMVVGPRMTTVFALWQRGIIDAEDTSKRP
jgi:hypothetical protein